MTEYSVFTDLNTQKPITVVSLFLYSQVIKLVNEVYRQFNQCQYPFVFLNLKMARDIVDVNVTPDKRQVFMDHEKLLIATIKVKIWSS
jgi:DNA mismatch repair ATPase MutL